MARQPFQKRLPNAELAFGAGLLSQRPMAASLIAQCVAGWTEVELQTARLLAAMLKADVEPVIALYFTLANERAKREAMTAIAEFVFNEEDNNLFDIIMKAKKSIEQQRNDLAHGLFGVTSDDISGVLWVSTKGRIRNMLNYDKEFKEAELYGESASKIKEFVSHYAIEDIEFFLNDITSMHRIMHQYVNYVADRAKPSFSEVLQSLLKEPLLQRFQSQATADKKSDL